MTKVSSFTFFQDELTEDLSDVKYAVEYLNTALDEFANTGELDSLLLPLRAVVKAQGGVNKVAKKSNLSRQNLYKALSEGGNPLLSTFAKILTGLHCKITVEAMEGEAHSGTISARMHGYIGAESYPLKDSHDDKYSLADTPCLETQSSEDIFGVAA